MFQCNASFFLLTLSSGDDSFGFVLAGRKKEKETENE